MIAVTAGQYRRAERAMSEAIDWATNHPHSDLVGWYNAHAAAINSLLPELDVAAGDMTSDEMMQSVLAVDARLKEIKSLASV